MFRRVGKFEMMQKASRFLFCGTAVAALCVGAPAQAISITPSNDAFALANTLFLNLAGLVVNSASLSTGAQSVGSSLFQAGTYVNPTGVYGLPNSGLTLSTGNVSDYGAGPNSDGQRTTAFGAAGTAEQNAVLAPITGQSAHFDVVQLDIEFFAASDATSATFFATFGSEEWPDFVGSSFVDGFGLYVNGTNVAGAQQSGGGANLPVNINHPDMSPIGGTELNAVLAPNGNPVLRFDVPINPAQANTFQLILADASDSQLDTTVYLSSFFSDDGGGGGSGAGATEFDPVLPSNPPDPVTGAFVIELPVVPAGETVWIDPPAAIGYEYVVEDGLAFATVTAPSLATVPDLDGYVIEVGGETSPLAAGATLDFAAIFGQTPSIFKLLGIDEVLGLDPLDPTAFPTGVSFVGDASGATVTMTPVVVPLPASAALYLSVLAVGAGAAWRRRR
jgi:hypothetical protein